MIAATTEHTIAEIMAGLTSHLAIYFLIYGQGTIECSNGKKMTPDPEGLFFNGILFRSFPFLVHGHAEKHVLWGVSLDLT